MASALAEVLRLKAQPAALRAILVDATDRMDFKRPKGYPCALKSTSPTALCPSIGPSWPIYPYNIHKLGWAAADRYIMLLNEKMDSSAINYEAGEVIESRPDPRYLLMLRRSGEDGISPVTLSMTQQTVDVRLIFHIKQDWENKL